MIRILCNARFMYHARGILAAGRYLVAVACLSGCATIDQHAPVGDWPVLKVYEHAVSHREMRDRCSPFVPPWQSPEGCTLFYFARGEAHIYVSRDFPSTFVLEHERQHAAGFDHVGQNHLREALRRSRVGG